MLDISTPLGRAVPTPVEILAVIKPELRVSKAIYTGVMKAMRDGWLDGDEDMKLGDGDDEAALNEVFGALKDAAMKRVKSYTRAAGLVFDEAAMQNFVHMALLAAESEDGAPNLPGEMNALDY